MERVLSYFWQCPFKKLNKHWRSNAWYMFSARAIDDGPLRFSVIYSQPARAKLQWTVNHKSCRSHMFFQSRGRCSWWQQQALSFSFFLSVFPFFFCYGKIIYGWIADVFFGPRLSECGEKLDGRNEREARGGAPWKCGVYHSIKIYATAAGLQLTASLWALDWHLSALLQIAFCVAPEPVSYPPGAQARSWNTNWRSSCEQPEGPAVVDTSRNSFSHTCAAEILKCHPPYLN